MKVYNGRNIDWVERRDEKMDWIIAAGDEDWRWVGIRILRSTVHTTVL